MSVLNKNSGKAGGVVWKSFPLGGPGGNETFLRGTTPKESLITQETSNGQTFQTDAGDFPRFFRLLDLNSEDYAAQSCPWVNSKHIPVLPRGSLTVLSPDFTSVIQKYGHTDKLVPVIQGIHIIQDHSSLCSHFSSSIFRYSSYSYQSSHLSIEA